GRIAAEIRAIQLDAVPGDDSKASRLWRWSRAVVDATDGCLEGVKSGQGASRNIGASDAAETRGGTTGYITGHKRRIRHNGAAAILGRQAAKEAVLLIVD